MARSRKREQVYKSMKEFEEKCFPQSFRKQFLKGFVDARTLGVNFAKESLDTVRSQLSQ